MGEFAYVFGGNTVTDCFGDHWRLNVGAIERAARRNMPTMMVPLSRAHLGPTIDLVVDGLDDADDAAGGDGAGRVPKFRHLSESNRNFSEISETLNNKSKFRYLIVDKFK